MASTTSETAPGIKPTPIQNDSPNDEMWPKIEQDSTCIRVLEVLPSGGGGKKEDLAIECLFHLVDVETTDLTYDTLSYVWGAGPATKAIRINGHERPVRENVYAALAKLRRETDSYFVWIDAVCINQADDEEKTHEVNLMQRIFARSAMCIIWLSDFAVQSKTQARREEGEDERPLTPAQVQAGFDMLDLVCRAADGKVTETPASLATVSQRRAAATAVKTMVYDDWWERLWTVQEVVLSRRAQILWGDLSIAWETVERASEIFTWDQQPDLPFDIFESFGPAINPLAMRAGSVRIVRHGRESPLDLLWRFRHRQASNPRDKVYGLMGLLRCGDDDDDDDDDDDEEEEEEEENDDEEEEEGGDDDDDEDEEDDEILFPTVQSCDYALDVVTLYKRMTLDLIRLDGGLMPLVGRRGERGPTEGLPSWAIDWMEDPDHAKRYGRYWPHAWAYHAFRADNNTPMQMAVSADDESVLSLGGVFVDTIAAVGSPVREHDLHRHSDSYEALRAHIDRWAELAAGFVGRKPGIQNFMGCPWEDRFRNLTNGVFPGGLDISEETENGWTWDMCVGQTLLLTENGHFGLGPFTAQPGDEIWILFGGLVPLVLRPRRQVGGERDNYELVGDAFVYDIMGGEFIRELDREHRTVHLN